MTESAPATNRPRRYRSPCLLILPSLFLPPLECCFGTIPIQAEKLRPDRKDFGSATVATTAVASTGPTPGASVVRRRAGFDTDQTWRQLLEERQDIATLQLPANNYLAAGINALD